MNITRPRPGTADMAQALVADPCAPIRARVAGACHLYRLRWRMEPWAPDVEVVQRAFTQRRRQVAALAAL